MPREFKILATETIHQAGRNTINLVHAETDGVAKTFCQVTRPLVVFAVPLSPTGRTVLIRQFRYPVARELWEFPAGHLEEGEDPANGAIRELVEETSLTADRLTPLGQFYAMPSMASAQYQVFIAHVTDAALDQIVTPNAEDEITAVHVMPWARVAELMLAGDDVAGPTMAVYGRVQAALAKGIGHG